MAYLELRDEILARLSRSDVDPQTVITELRETQNGNRSLNATVLQTLCDIHLSEEEACRELNNVMLHQRALERTLRRGVDFRTALLDYFTAERAQLDAPLIIETTTYTENLRFATIDELTGLSNRRYLNDFLERELHRAHRHSHPLSVLLIDLDDFKAINDNLGHQVGDEVLQRFARFLLEQLRAEDVPARYGGEEFVVVMPQTGPEGALTVANRLIDAAARQKLHDLVRIRFSAGLATYPEHGLSVRQILGAADTAMYQAKISGKGTVRQAHADKRSHERYRAELDVLYSFDGTFVNTGVTRDLSLSGVRFETDKRLEVGQPITLTIRSTNDDATYRVRSHVVWLNEVQDKQVYRCGAKYAQPQNDVAESLVEQVASQHP